MSSIISYKKPLLKSNHSSMNAFYIILLILLMFMVTFINCWTLDKLNKTKEDKDSNYIEQNDYRMMLSYLKKERTMKRSNLRLVNDGAILLKRLSFNSKDVKDLYKSSCMRKSSMANEMINESCDEQTGHSSKLLCIDNVCRCPPEHGYQYEIGECIHFTNFHCNNNAHCQDSDFNLICSNSTKKCKCRSGFIQNIETKLCIETAADNQTTHRNNILHVHRTNSAILGQKAEQNYFEPHSSCSTTFDCQGDFVYCYRGECRCWPEFNFVSVRYLNHNETNEVHVPDYGFCRRRICTSDVECKRIDNPNLICNNSICECRFGYHMKSDLRICTRSIARNRHGCDMTCRVIGGVFAIVFLMTLLYWCFYCVYYIIKNYYNKPMNVFPSGSLSNSGWLGASMNSIHSRAVNEDVPPPYESLKLNYESPPKYEAAIEMCNMSRSQVNQSDNNSQTELDKLLTQRQEDEGEVGGDGGGGVEEDGRNYR